DGLAWGILPLLFAAGGLSVEAIGVLAAIYPGVWCVGQLFTGAWSDRVGRKPLITAGMILQGIALALMATATGFGPWPVGAVLIGAPPAFEPCFPRPSAGGSFRRPETRGSKRLPRPR